MNQLIRKIQELNPLLGILYFLYILISVLKVGTVFRNGLFIPTLLLTFLFTFTLPIANKKIEDLLDMCIRFTISTVAVVLALFVFVAKDFSNIDANNAAFAANSSGWLIIFLFGSILFAILGKSHTGGNKLLLSRIALSMFLLAFLILLSFVAGGITTIKGL